MIAAADYNLLLQHINEHFGTSRSDLSGHIYILPVNLSCAYSLNIDL
jgi:hypothetical protein